MNTQNFKIMKTTLIKLQDEFILVNDEEIKEGEMVYHPEVSQEFTKVYPLKEGGERYTKGRHVMKGVYRHRLTTNPWRLKERKIIAGIPELPSTDLSLLKEEDCKTIGWVDVEKLAEKKFPTPVGIYKSGSGYIVERNKWKEGFKAAQSLNDKKFSLEDMREAIEIGINLASKHHDSAHGMDYEMVEVDKDIYIQSLQQTEWEVEVNEFNQITKIL